MAEAQNVQELINTYQTAQANLIKLIAEKEARGNVVAYQKQMLASIEEELRTLNKYTAQWMKTGIPEAYLAGAATVYAAYRAANIDISKTRQSGVVVRNLVENTTGALTDANNFVGRKIKDDLRQAGLEATTASLSMGETSKMTKQLLLQKMTDKGILSIVDKGGRAIKMDVYAAMVARTTIAEATNKGVIQKVTDIGEDLVEMSTSLNCCELCSIYEGRVYSISGTSTEYPPLDAMFSGDYANIHPNCTHTLEPYIKEFDDNADQKMTDSNRPFEVDSDQQKSIDKYNNQQAVKAARRTDRNAWQEAQLLAPNDTPKTFSAFRSMKRADSEKYQAIQETISKVKKA